MTGPEHYAEAERLLAAAEQDHAAGDREGNRREHDVQVARAQVHATLAQAAATVETASTRGGGWVTAAWRAAVGWGE